MVAITLPDGSERKFDGPVTGAELAADIGPVLAKAALAVRVDGEIRDLSVAIEADAEVELVVYPRPKSLFELLRGGFSLGQAAARLGWFPLPPARALGAATAPACRANTV